MEKAVQEGKLKSIGLSNFHGKYLEDILKVAKIMPVVDQVECHPYFPNNELRNELKNIGAVWNPKRKRLELDEEDFKKLDNEIENQYEEEMYG